jgi:predicted GH43/DUF377 family glycosyl hydrolase
VTGAIRRRLVSRGDLPGSNGGIYNPGALLTERSILLLCRREIDYRFEPALVFPELITIDRSTLDVVRHRTLTKVGFSLDTRIEDFRCIAFNGLRLAVHSTVRPDRIKPMISRLYDDALQRYDDFELPVAPVRVEKNWVLFEHQGALHCLYKLDPLTIFVRREPGQWELVAESDNGWATRFERSLSNSANLIPVEDGYLGFWHSIVHDRYVQGAFLLGHDLRLQYHTGTLLDGADVHDGFKPGVLYVSALVDDGARVLAFYGEGDAHTGVALFDRAELLQELHRHRFVSTNATRVRYQGETLSDAFRALQRLREFAERTERSRIRLYVDPAMRATFERLAFPRLHVHAYDAESDHPDAYDCTITGSGKLTWR